MTKLIITIAPTGSIPTKKNNPNVPISPDEIIQTGILCEKAGASNEQLVKRIVQASNIMNRKIATPDEARKILGLV